MGEVPLCCAFQSRMRFHLGTARIHFGETQTRTQDRKSKFTTKRVYTPFHFGHILSWARFQLGVMQM